MAAGLLVALLAVWQVVVASGVCTSTRASVPTSWCIQNCYAPGTTNLVHPACRPDTPAANRVCQCSQTPPSPPTACSFNGTQYPLGQQRCTDNILYECIFGTWQPFRLCGNCTFDGSSFFPGDKRCTNNTRFRCWSGQWTKNGTCNSLDAIALQSFAGNLSDCLGWEKDADPCTLSGVTCDQSNTQVLTLSIEYKPYCIGTVNLTNLPESLQQLELIHNGFYGQVDTSTLPHLLTILTLTGNHFNGTVDLTSLPTLLTNVSLAQNNFSGTVDLTFLPPNITSLDLSNNKFNGTVNITNIPSSLISLNLSHNRFTKLIWNAHALAQLTELDIYGNPWKCPIPSIFPDVSCEGQCHFRNKTYKSGAERCVDGVSYHCYEGLWIVLGVCGPVVNPNCTFENVNYNELSLRCGNDSILYVCIAGKWEPLLNETCGGLNCMFGQVSYAPFTTRCTADVLYECLPDGTWDVVNNATCGALPNKANCTSISPAVPTSWCEVNCYPPGTRTLLHPGCRPSTPLPTRVCICS